MEGTPVPVVFFRIPVPSPDIRVLFIPTTVAELLPLVSTSLESSEAVNGLPVLTIPAVAWMSAPRPALATGTKENEVDGDVPGPPPITNWPAPRAVDEDRVELSEKYGIPPEVPVCPNTNVPEPVTGPPVKPNIPVAEAFTEDTVPEVELPGHLHMLPLEKAIHPVPPPVTGALPGVPSIARASVKALRLGVGSAAVRYLAKVFGTNCVLA